MNLEFFGEGPALLVEGEKRYLIAADLHFGIEADLAGRGIHFRSRSRSRLSRLLKLVDSTDPDGLVLLGDIKHSISPISRQEHYELPWILRTLREHVPLQVFAGNHDAGIERFLLPDEICRKEGEIIDGVGYLHGHIYPSPELAGHLIIAGHHHPLLSLCDEVGCALQSPAYLRAGLDTYALGMARTGPDGAPTRLLLMPSFNEIAGYDIFQMLRDPISPLSRHILPEEIEVILADGTYIGPLTALIPDESD